MSKEIISENPQPITIDRVPYTDDEYKPRHRAKRIVRTFLAGLVLAGAGYVGYKLDKRDNLVKNAQKTENALIQNDLKNGTKVANVVAKVAAGVNERSTPSQINNYGGPLSPILPYEGNTAATVAKNSTLFIKDPSFFVAKDGDTYMEFQYGNGSHVNAKKRESVAQIAQQTFYIDVSQVENQQSVYHKKLIEFITPDGRTSATIPEHLQYQKAVYDWAGQLVSGNLKDTGVVDYAFEASNSVAKDFGNLVGNPNL